MTRTRHPWPPPRLFLCQSERCSGGRYSILVFLGQGDAPLYEPAPGRTTPWCYVCGSKAPGIEYRPGIVSDAAHAAPSAPAQSQWWTGPCPGCGAVTICTDCARCQNCQAGHMPWCRHAPGDRVPPP